MAASGLSVTGGDAEKNEHLCQLAEFSLDMENVVETVNQHSKFKFKIRGGEYHCFQIVHSIAQIAYANVIKSVMTI